MKLSLLEQLTRRARDITEETQKEFQHVPDCADFREAFREILERELLDRSPDRTAEFRRKILGP